MALIEALGFMALFMLLLCVNTAIVDKITQVIHRLAQTNAHAPGVPPFLQSKKDIKKLWRELAFSTKADK